MNREARRRLRKSAMSAGTRPHRDAVFAAIRQHLPVTVSVVEHRGEEDALWRSVFHSVRNQGGQWADERRPLQYFTFTAGMTRSDLVTASGLTTERVEAIWHGRIRGTIDEFQRLARGIAHHITENGGTP